MRIHAICVVKNEADILAETLAAASAWCDRIYVLDNGSTDGTWELIRALSQQLPRVVPFKQDGRVFLDSIRRDIYFNFSSEGRNGDWWCRLDADEIYEDDPRAILSATPPHFDFVWSSVFNFYLTDTDIAAWQADPDGWPTLPVTKRIRHYRNNWSEPRFFRHKALQFWRRSHDWPSLMTSDPVNRIRQRHYQYRSPEQITRRVETRRATARAGGTPFFHENTEGTFHRIVANPTAAVAALNAGTDFVPTPKALDEKAGIDWHDRIMPAADLDLCQPGQPLIERPDILPPIHPTSEVKRLLRRVLRPALIPLADRI